MEVATFVTSDCREDSFIGASGGKTLITVVGVLNVGGKEVTTVRINCVCRLRKDGGRIVGKEDSGWLKGFYLCCFVFVHGQYFKAGALAGPGVFSCAELEKELVERGKE